jgi:hypothetical protein
MTSHEAEERSTVLNRVRSDGENAEFPLTHNVRRGDCVDSMATNERSKLTFWRV